jgi:ferredoxin
MLFWSGTGNSRVCAEMAAGYCSSRGLASRAGSLGEGIRMRERGGAAIVGLFIPTHGFTAPWAAVAEALRLPRGRGTTALVGACGGALDDGGSGFVPGFTGTAAWVAALALSMRGYRVRSILALDMPANWLVVPLAPDESLFRRCVPCARREIEGALERLLGGGAAIRPRALAHLAAGLLLLPLSVAYLVAVRFVLSQLLFAGSGCDACGACEAGCPLGAVKLRGRRKSRPDWSLACQSCMRCVSRCPRGAIRQSLPWTIAASYLSVVAASAAARSLVPRIASLAPPALGGIIGAAVALVALLSAARLSGIALRALARIAPLAKLLERYSRSR